MSINTQLVEEFLRKATACMQAGRFREVIPLCEAVLVDHPKIAFAWNLLGLAQQSLGNFRSAAEHLQRATTLEPRNPTFHNNYGVCLQHEGKFIEARVAFSTALKLQATYQDAYANLYLSHLRSGEYAAAFQVVDSAIQHHSLPWDVWLQAIQKAIDLAHTPKAEEWIRIASERTQREISVPELSSRFQGELHRLQGQLLLNAGWPEKSLSELELGCQLAPSNDVLRSELAKAHSTLHDHATAQQQVRQARSFNPNRLAWQLQEMCLTPVVFSSEEELLQHRHQLESSLDELLNNDCRIPFSELLAANFLPPYVLGFHGMNDRPIKEKFAALCRSAITPMCELTSTPDKPRVGFLVTQGHEGLFLRIMQRIIEHLADSRDLEVVVLCSHTIASRMQHAFAEKKVEIIPFLNHPLQAAGQVARAACQVIHYCEVGSDIINYLLPLFRLAPIQCTSWAIQSTTGMPEVDYYLSSDRVEDVHAQEFYTEKLIRLPSLLTVQTPLERPSDATRKRLELPEKGTLYVCPQTLLKLHPRQDAVFHRILDGDPNGYLILKNLQYSKAGELLLKRFTQSMPEMLDRIILMPWLSTMDYRRLLCVADVILDSVVFSAGSSAYDVFSFNKPLVTCLGDYFPSRFAAACYRDLGFTELIADGPDSYVELALKLGHDSQYRAWCEAELTKRTPNWFAATPALSSHREVLSEWAFATR